MLLARLSLLSLASALFCACSPAKVSLGAPPPCQGCVPSGGGTKGPGTTGSGGGSGSGEGGNGQGGGETATVTGNVEAVNSFTFDTAFAYTKPGFIYGDGLAGKQLGAEYDGSVFTLEGVASGETWFRAGPKDTSDTVFPTYSVQHIPADKLVLPMLDQQVLQTIGLDAGLAISTLHAQIVLRVTDGTKPLAGITAESEGAGLILYDVGSASYSAQVTGTGARGIIVLLNQAPAAIVLTDAAAHTYQVDVRAIAGTATLLDLAL
jgi:hypothetical protein